MDQLDFRSDTVTWPTPEMREAMANAPVGDDVMGEDPTVNQLQREAAGRLGMDCGLFVPSGTAGNLIAAMTHAQRGDEAILGYESHMFQWEAGSVAAIGGIQPHPLPTDLDGRMDLAAVEAAIRSDNIHYPRSRLILAENSFGGRGGVALPIDYFEALREIADRHGLAVHLDGARLWNAAVALDVDAAELCKDVDSVTFCLSKGLCAPVGSVLCGSRAFIDGARRIRKALGGGMRQAGILAAAGLVALDCMIDRLADDHQNAKELARGLDALDGVRVDISRVQTNIVFFQLVSRNELATPLDPDQLCARLRDDHGILLGTYPGGFLRAVLHRWIGEAEVSALVGAIRQILA